jgi:hypothetical protein
MTDTTKDLEFDDPDIEGIDDDELPADDEEFGGPPAPASMVPVDPEATS